MPNALTDLVFLRRLLVGGVLFPPPSALVNNSFITDTILLRSDRLRGNRNSYTRVALLARLLGTRPSRRASPDALVCAVLS
jgi:hypothetical protein